jgi:hypothetical protein
MGFMNAAFGVRFFPEDFRRVLFRPPFFAAFLPLDLDDLREDFRDEDFLPPFFFVAILSPGLVIGCKFCRVKRVPSATQTIVPRGESNRESEGFPYEKVGFSEGESAHPSGLARRLSPHFFSRSSSSFIIFTS